MDQDMYFYGKRVLFIGAHPDDIEIGAGALIAHIINQTDVICVTLSDNQKNPDLMNVVNEHYHSMDVLGVIKENIILSTFETRRFPHFRQEILENLISLNNFYKPDIIFTHTRSDIHQDHLVVMEECLRAFRGITVFGFDVLRSTYGFFPNFLVEVFSEDVDKKISALSEYKTYASKYYFSKDITRSTLIRNGALAERQFAEGFDILRVIGKFGYAHT